MLFKELKKESEKFFESIKKSYKKDYSYDEFFNVISFNIVKDIEKFYQTYLPNTILRTPYKKYIICINTNSSELEVVPLFAIKYDIQKERCSHERIQIKNIVMEIETLPLFNTQNIKHIAFKYEELYNYIGKKIKMRDDIQYIYNTINQCMQYEKKLMLHYTYAKMLNCAVQLEKAQNIFSTMMQDKLVLYGHHSSFYYQIDSSSNLDSVNEKTNQLVKQKRIYQVVFEIEETPNNKQTKSFDALSMDDVKFFLQHYKDEFINSVHENACGTAKMTISITNVFTHHKKILIDFFGY